MTTIRATLGVIAAGAALFLLARQSLRLEPAASPLAAASASTTTSASATPGPSPTWEVREFDGLYGRAFEQSDFVEGSDKCPNVTWWWLVSNRAFLDRFAALTAYRSPFGSPIGETTTYIVHARFLGRLSPPGEYGHLGGYSRQIEVVTLLDMQDTQLCGMDLPDLALASYRYGWTNELPGGCSRGGAGPATLELCIVNQGRKPAGDAWVDVHSSGDVLQRRICGLLPGETRCLPPVPAPASYIVIDSRNDVHERFEDNNWTGFGLYPTVPPPPTCTALPPGVASPTAVPTATSQDCVTPTAGPPTTEVATPSPSSIAITTATVTASATVTDMTTPTPMPRHNVFMPAANTGGG